MRTLNKMMSAVAILGASVAFSPITLAAFYDGMYFSGFIGVSKALNEAYSNGPNTFRYAINSDHGFNIGGAIGYRFDCFRAEFSIAYTKNDDDRIDITDDGTPLATGSDTGDQTSILFMINGYYDFMTNTGFIPFIGAGIGAAHLRHDYRLGDVSIDDNDTVFAYQIILGVGSDITENLRINLDYRFIGTTDAEFSFNGSASGAKTRGNYLNHQLNLGLTYFI